MTAMSTTTTTRLSRLKTPKDSDPVPRDNSSMSPVNGSSTSPFKRVGLSEYTSQRLAELKARRAEADEELRALQRIPTGDHSPLSRNLNSSTHREGKATTPVRQVGTESALDNLKHECNKPNDQPPNSGLFPHVISAYSTGGRFADGSPISNDCRECDSNTRDTFGRKDQTSPQRNLVQTKQEADPNETYQRIDKESINTKIGDARHLHHLDFPTPNTDQQGLSVPADEGDFVGFASLPDQVHRKAVKKGFDFTLMVVGESGLGKSTLVSCLFQNASLYRDRALGDCREMINKTVAIEKKVLEIEEKGVKLRLTIIDTPGFNDALDNSTSWKSICNHIDDQHEKYFADENGINRRSIVDSRVHCCLFFLSPLGRGVRQTELTLMKELQSRVNLIPVISKADTLTCSEIKKLKEKILEDTRKHDIKMYELPECASDEDEEFLRQDKELKAAIPFAVIGSNTVLEIGGKKIRGRMYPWGVVEVDNPRHCDFSKLRQFLIGTHMQDLKDVTEEYHYENFRARHLQEQMTNTKQKERKLKRESIQNFDKILDADYLLKQKEEEIQKMKELLQNMQSQLTNNKVTTETK